MHVARAINQRIYPLEKPMSHLIQGLRAQVTHFDAEHPTHEKSVPVGVIVGTSIFLVWMIVQAGSLRLIIIGFLFFLAFVDATRHVSLYHRGRLSTNMLLMLR